MLHDLLWELPKIWHQKLEYPRARSKGQTKTFESLSSENLKFTMEDLTSILSRNEYSMSDKWVIQRILIRRMRQTQRHSAGLWRVDWIWLSRVEKHLRWRKPFTQQQEMPDMSEWERVDKNSWKGVYVGRKPNWKSALGPNVEALKYQPSLHCALEVRSSQFWSMIKFCWICCGSRNIRAI